MTLGSAEAIAAIEALPSSELQALASAALGDEGVRQVMAAAYDKFAVEDLIKIRDSFNANAVLEEFSSRVSEIVHDYSGLKDLKGLTDEELDEIIVVGKAILAKREKAARRELMEIVLEVEPKALPVGAPASGGP